MTMNSTTRTFTCYVCGKVDTIEEGDDEDALAELAIHFPGVAPQECAVLCDECYLLAMADKTSQN